jgi:UDP-N-acetylglucosamine 2-epimerase (non-hydrolysing)
VLVGTRPTVIKQAPIIRELRRQGVPFFVIHTGQHYSYDLDQAFFVDLELEEPDFRLEGIGNCKLHGEQTAEILRQTEEILLMRRPKVFLVVGDTNSSLSGALAARKLNLRLAHNESGLRSYKWEVPEEHNRVMIDHISDYLFAPSERAKETLEEERVKGMVFVTGTTICDALTANLEIARQKSRIIERLALTRRQYIVMTLHHEENVDYREQISKIINGVSMIVEEFEIPIVFPVHPRTRLRIRHFGLEKTLYKNRLVRPIEPLGYLDFLALVANSVLVMTDSGGLIQEAAILRIPCLTLGCYTEWTEVVEVGANSVSMNDPELMLVQTRALIEKDRTWENPFSKPGAACRIVEILKQCLC